MGKLGEMLKHPDEITPLVAMYMAARKAKKLPKEPGLAFCYDMLNRVSRSFAVVIQQLPESLRDAVCVFYLVLRALDTVEDDMSIPDDVKIPLLRCFHEKSYDRSWSMSCGAGHYIELMERYPLVTDVFLNLDTEYQLVIADICKQMGNGMADFIPKEVKTVEEYNLYCHYVAGLVGIGLSQLFASSGLENKSFYRMKDLANEMGLFLQKTNIIRDYLEDINEEPAPRMFWPKEIWGEYAPNGKLADFKEPENAKEAVECLNHMILNALGHVESCLVYMEKLKNPAIFRFCAIPQVMAIATLSLCYNNHNVFTGVVKMRRGETAKVWHDLEDYGDMCAVFRKYTALLSAKAQAQAVDDPNQEQVIATCGAIDKFALGKLKAMGSRLAAQQQAMHAMPLPLSTRLMMLVFALLYAAYAFQMAEVREYLGMPMRTHVTSLDKFNRGVAAMILGYVLVIVITGKKIQV